MSKKDPTFEVGTELWLKNTGGKLTVSQAFKLSVQGFAQTFSEKLPRSKSRAHFVASLQLARVVRAQKELSPILEAFRERVLDRQGEAILNHTCRTYLLGAALVQDEVFEHLDHRVAAVAALAHDYGLVHPSTPGDCFTGDSAIEAKTMMTQLGASNLSIDNARFAVISHFQPRLPTNSSPEAQLVALGASADVMGIGLARIDPKIINQIWRQWPDLGFLFEVKQLLIGEIRRAPRTRPGILARSGMPYLLRKSKASEVS